MSLVVLDVQTLSGAGIASVETGADAKVDDVFEELLSCGEHRIPSLVYGELHLAPKSLVREYITSEGRHIIQAIFRSKEWLEEQFPPHRAGERMSSTAQQLMRTDFESRKNRDSAMLRHTGYTGRQLRQTGFSATELRPCLDDMYIPTFTMRSCGFSVSNMLDAGFEQRVLKKHGFTVRDFVESGIRAERELMQAGFTALDFLSAGFTIAQLQQLSFTAKVMQQAGCWSSELREAGYSAGDLKMAGFTLVQLKEGGYTLLEMKDGGYALWVLARSGYTMKQLEAVGFSVEDLTAAGYVIPAPKCSARASRSGKQSSPVPSRPGSGSIDGRRQSSFLAAGNHLINVKAN